MRTQPLTRAQHHLAPCSPRRSRPAGLGAAALLLTLTGVLTACGGSEDAPDTSKADASSSPSPGASTSTTPSSSPSATVANGPQLRMSVAGRKVTPTGKEIKLGVGETLTITVTSDRAGELHVHSSPEQELAYGKGQTSLKLRIDKPGVVDVEDHIADALVAQLQVS